MPLSCSCDYDGDYGPGDWLYDIEADRYFIEAKFFRRKRCCSCGKLIDLFSLCNEYTRYRYPVDEIEAKIKVGCELDNVFDDEPTIKIASHYHCEKCAEIWLNLTEIGYECLMPYENMEGALKEYHIISGFKEWGKNEDNRTKS